MVSPNRRYTCREFLHEVKWEVVSPNRRYTCREFLHEVNWKVVSPDSTVGIYIQYIYMYITKIVVLVSEPVRVRSRATALPCYCNIPDALITYKFFYFQDVTLKGALLETCISGY